MHLQFIAIREDGASTRVEKIPGALRVHLILPNPMEKGSKAGPYSLIASVALGRSLRFPRRHRRLAHAAL